MIWILFILIGGLVLVNILKYKLSAASGGFTTSMMLPDQAEHAAAKKQRELELSQRLRQLGLSPSPSQSGPYTFALPHTHMPLSLTLSSTVTSSTIKVHGTIPDTSPFRALTVLSGHHTETRLEGDPRTHDLFIQCGMRDELFLENAHHHTTQCRVDAHGNFDVTLQLSQDAQLDIACAWLGQLQHRFTRHYELWHEELRDHINASHPERAEQAMRYLQTWHPEDTYSIYAASEQLNDHAHVVLLDHLHRGTGHPLAPRSIAYIEGLISTPQVCDDLKIHAMHVALHASMTVLDPALCSEALLAILSRREPPTTKALELVVGSPHPVESLCAMIDAIVEVAQTLPQARAIEITELLLDASWDHMSSRKSMHDYYTAPDVNFGPLTMLTLEALFAEDPGSMENVSRLQLNRTLLADTPYLMWERLVLHRADELRNNATFLDIIAQQVIAKRQRHAQLCRLLIVHLGCAPDMPSRLQRMLPYTEPHTAAGWIRCAALIVEHLVEHPPMLEIILELLPMCPSEDTARRVAAQLPKDAIEVQDFLVHWTLTPRSARHALLDRMEQGEEMLSVTRVTALITLLAHRHTGHTYHEQVLALIATRGPIESIKLLHELPPHTRAFQRPVQQTLEALLIRFNAQGGELSLSKDSRQGALSLNDPSQ